jgi:hypothetical protein
LRVLRGCDTRVGDQVRFQVGDVFLHSPGGLSPLTEEEEELEGTVIDFSDCGSEHRFFAVIEVIRRASLIVPVDKLEAVKPPASDDDT